MVLVSLASRPAFKLMPIHILGHSLLQVVLDDHLLALAKDDGTSLGSSANSFL
jgi:hypothetical protein